MPVVDTSSQTTLLQEDEYTYIGPGLVECADRGICMFNDSLAEECNLISLVSISVIRTDDDLNLVVASDIKTESSAISILQGCEMTCSDCTFLSQIDEVIDSSPFTEETSSSKDMNGTEPPGEVTPPENEVGSETNNMVNANGPDQSTSIANVKHLPNVLLLGFLTLVALLP